MVHQLKCEHNFFEDTISGWKPFEVRLNDRDFKVGDFLALNEIKERQCSTEKPTETGRCCLVEVVYVLTDERFVKPGYAIVGHRSCAIVRSGGYSEMHDSERFYRVPVYDTQTLEAAHENRTNANY